MLNTPANAILEISSADSYSLEGKGNMTIPMTTQFSTMQDMMKFSKQAEEVNTYTDRRVDGSLSKLHKAKNCFLALNAFVLLTHFCWLAVINTAPPSSFFSSLKLSMITPTQRLSTKKLPMKMKHTKKRLQTSCQSLRGCSMGFRPSTAAYMTSTHISVVAISNSVNMAAPSLSKCWLRFSHLPPRSTHVAASLISPSVSTSCPQNEH
mmetsp:Transcript_67548/g.154919  ORF Transcript_67548/g.154919 Transcript_67548/m.154919 type:complete len:208 (-) Transcript_67548:749-1372(-)